MISFSAARLRYGLVFCLLLSLLASSASASMALTPEEEVYLEERGHVIRFVHAINFMPFEFTDRYGDAAGIMPDFVRWMAKRIGFEVEFCAATSVDRWEGVLSGEYDVMASCFHDGQVFEEFAVTPVVMDVPVFLYVSAAGPIHSLDDLHGAVVALEREIDPGFEYIPLFCDMLDETVKAVASGRAAALVCMEPALKYYEYTRSRGFKLRAVEPPLDVKKLSLSVAAANSPLHAMLSRAVEESQDEGVARGIFRKWVGPEYLAVGSQILKRIQYVITGLVVLITVVLLFWLWDIRLTRHVREKTQALQHSEERLRTVFQNSPDAIFVEDENGVVLDANPVACAMHNMTRRELIGKNMFELASSCQREIPRGEFHKWFTGELKRMEGLALTAAGREAPVEVIGSPIRFEGKSAVLLLVRDVTERKRAEQALKESELRYRGLIEAQSNFIVRVSPEGVFTFVNEAFCRFLGRSHGELIDSDYKPFVFYQDFSAVQEVIETLLGRRERVVTIEHRMQTTSGIKWVRWENVAVFDEEGRVTELQSMGQDITERRRIHEALQESEKRLRFLFEGIPNIAVQGYNENREVIFWNKASEKLYGYSREEALGQRIEELIIQPDLRASIVEAIHQWVQGNNPIPPGEMIKRNRDGDPVMVYSSRMATYNQHGDWEMYVIDIDLSTLRQAEADLLRAKEAAERANRAKSEFLANMSHEVRTPMNGVMGMTQLLMNTDLSGEQRDALETIMDSTCELLRIIDEILDISRIEAGEITLQPEFFAAAEIAEKVVLLFADRASCKGINLSVEASEQIPRNLMGDVGRFRQVLLNLVSNALKFTYEGSVTIKLDGTAEEGCFVLQGQVIDTGIGISDEHLEHIFDKFTQGDASSTREYGGAGLGLAITRQLLELMGGTVRAESKEGEGSTFYFTLPLTVTDQVAEKPGASVLSADEIPAIEADILLVEDNLVNQKVAAAMLRKLGCRVTMVSHGGGALQKLSEKVYDLIFMDCQMPVMDGFTATRAIREMVGPVSEIPVVAMTAHALKGDRERCLEAGMNDYLAKPVHQNVLIEILVKYCA